MSGERNLNFDEIVNRKNTGCLKYDFAVKRGKPEDVLPLWIADMDFRTSSYIIDAIKERVDDGIFGYTEPLDSYYEALAGWMERHHDFHVDKESVVVTPGVVYALSQAILAFTEAGDSVILQSPVYYPFYGIIKDNHRRVVENPLIQREDGKYEIDFEDFERKIEENDVKLFLFCNPHNPGGRVYREDEIKKLGEICLKNNVIVISDEIHEDFVFDGYRHIPFTKVDERFKGFTVIATSPTKTFNLAGLQVSNIIIEDKRLRHKFKAAMWASGYSQLNIPGIVAGEAAYRDGDEWYEAVRQYIYENIQFTKEYIKMYIPRLKVIEPEGTYLIWIDCRGLGLEPKELDDLMVYKAKLWLDDGAIFGKVGEGFERINAACPRAILEEALDRIRDAVSEILHD